jgi:accessory colonization factor AcfA
MLTPAAFAAPYVGIEYGVTSMDTEYKTIFANDNITLNPHESDTSFGGFVGYRFDSLGLELGYKQYSADDSKSRFIGIVDNVKQEREWDADVTAKQLILKPVYFYNLNEKLLLKTGLGLTYTQYKYNSSTHDEYESLTIDDLEYDQPRSGGEASSDNVFGAIASVGIEYKVIQNLAVGASASYQLDSIASTSSFMVNATYYF